MKCKTAECDSTGYINIKGLCPWCNIKQLKESIGEIHFWAKKAIDPYKAPEQRKEFIEDIVTRSKPE